MANQAIQPIRDHEAKCTLCMIPGPIEFHEHVLEAIEHELAKKKYKMVTVTHVDTITGVLSDIAGIGLLVRQKFPNTLVVVDGVRSVGCEEIKFDDFGLDIVLTGSQKVLALHQVYPLLSLLSVPSNYYTGWNRRIPIVQGYESRKPTYFATPAVQLVMALNVSLKQLLTYGVENNFAKHHEVSNMVKNSLESWGLKLVPISRIVAAHAMTAVYYPEGIQVTDLLPKMAAQGITIASGLHPTIASKYFRIGHIGISATQPERGRIKQVLSSVQASLRECGYKC